MPEHECRFSEFLCTSGRAIVDPGKARRRRRICRYAEEKQRSQGERGPARCVQEFREATRKRNWGPSCDEPQRLFRCASLSRVRLGVLRGYFRRTAFLVSLKSPATIL